VPGLTRVYLAGLSVQEVREFVIASARRELPVGFAETLFDQTEGNPLFLREIVRFLEQRGALSAEHEHAAVGIRIPEGIREVIGRRLNLLSPECNGVLALASVIGRDFGAELLLREATPLDREMLIEALDEAISAHVIEETAPGRYQFTHNLIRITLYDELRTAQRRQFHRVIGRAINHSTGPTLTRSCRNSLATFSWPETTTISTKPLRTRSAPANAPTRCSRSKMRPNSFKRHSIPWSSAPTWTRQSIAASCCCSAKRSVNRATFRRHSRCSGTQQGGRRR
jgi:hypothetical protein